MKTYRTYFYNEAGIVAFVQRLECENEAGAMAAMQALLNKTSYSSAELWHLGRRVGVIQRTTAREGHDTAEG